MLSKLIIVFFLYKKPTMFSGDYLHLPHFGTGSVPVRLQFSSSSVPVRLPFGSISAPFQLQIRWNLSFGIKT